MKPVPMKSVQKKEVRPSPSAVNENPPGRSLTPSKTKHMWFVLDIDFCMFQAEVSVSYTVSLDLDFLIK